ncbi:MAG: hypothetical protein PVH87_05220 [Desulfobacteraceae bacterium]|jgi:hypothetical protein
MIEKKETKHTNDTRANYGKSHKSDNRLREERRKLPSNGFTYISSVGWIDRRERLRRKDDPDVF